MASLCAGGTGLRRQASTPNIYNISTDDELPAKWSIATPNSEDDDETLSNASSDALSWRSDGPRLLAGRDGRRPKQSASGRQLQQQLRATRRRQARRGTGTGAAGPGGEEALRRMAQEETSQLREKLARRRSGGAVSRQELAIIAAAAQQKALGAQKVA
mmetsp:Transcript_96492/g.242037  ORF Transcript_96492/g.242037 Transcript_96492/m.242037 type:complete len:159 (+) Transcript_96492:41-517(+)